MGLLPADFRCDGRLSTPYCKGLERGEILLFRDTPFPLDADDRRFLLTVRQSTGGYHKNVSYRPRDDRIRGLDRKTGNIENLRRIMKAYSRNVAAFVLDFLSPYAAGLRLDFASFRPVEEQGRKMPLTSRNDLLHVDAFPTRPTNGDRILRVFTNIHPAQSRCWVTSDTFETIAKEMAVDAGLRAFSHETAIATVRRKAIGTLRRLGLPFKDVSPYDSFMLSFHDYLKKSRKFQERCPKYYWDFPPGSTWIVFTDMVPHAVLSGQFALEQTFIVGRDSLLLPDYAPASVLERLAGTSLTYPTSTRSAA